MTQPDLDQLTSDQLADMPDDEVLHRAADWLREDAEIPVDDTERAVLALMQAGATAATTDRPEDHLKVTAALGDVARAMFREELGQPEPTGGTA